MSEMNFENKEPLVSVVVITYNSSAFVLETLESVKAQTYGNIELIVTDDCSKDDTVKICNEWISANRDRFANAFVRSSEVNHGIVNNINEGIKCASGEYVKYIAGDDLLLPNCISDNVSECKSRNIRYLFTWLHKFTDTEEGRKEWKEEPNFAFFFATPEKQHKMLLRKNYIYGPLFFAEKSFIEEMGMLNEDYAMIEDYPMWLKISGLGNELHFKNTETVAYRISESSVSNGSGGRVISVIYYNSYRKFYKEKIRPELWKRFMLLKLMIHGRDAFYSRLIIKLGNERSKKSVRFVEFFHKRKYLNFLRRAN